jgi:nucleolar protein 9
MPREQRKRGKKHRKEVEEPSIHHVEPVYEEDEEAPEAGPSWITKSNEHTQSDVDAPFGELDQDLKTYFRTVDTQMKQWIQEHLEPAEGDEEKDPNEGVYFPVWLM